MSKKKAQKTPAVKCRCSRCKQVACAKEGTIHFYCTGIDPDIRKALPDAFQKMTNPTRKGVWERINEVRVDFNAAVQALVEQPSVYR